MNKSCLIPHRGPYWRPHLTHTSFGDKVLLTKWEIKRSRSGGWDWRFSVRNVGFEALIRCKRKMTKRHLDIWAYNLRERSWLKIQFGSLQNAGDTKTRSWWDDSEKAYRTRGDAEKNLRKSEQKAVDRLSIKGAERNGQRGEPGGCRVTEAQEWTLEWVSVHSLHTATELLLHARCRSRHCGYSSEQSHKIPAQRWFTLWSQCSKKTQLNEEWRESTGLKLT